MIFNCSVYSKRMTSKNGNDFFRLMINKEDIDKVMGEDKVLVVRVMDQDVREDKNGNAYVQSFLSAYTPKPKS